MAPQGPIFFLSRKRAFCLKRHRL